MTSTSRDNHFLPAHIGLTKHVDTKTHDTSTDALLATLEISLLGLGTSSRLDCKEEQAFSTYFTQAWETWGALLLGLKIPNGLKSG